MVVPQASLLFGFLMMAAAVVARFSGADAKTIRAATRLLMSRDHDMGHDAVPAALLLLGLPIYITLLATCAVVIVFFYSIPATALPQIMFGSLDNSALLAVPFFIFAGEIMGTGGISRRLVNWSRVAVRRHAKRACRSRPSRPASCSARSPALRPPP